MGSGYDMGSFMFVLIAIICAGASVCYWVYKLGNLGIIFYFVLAVICVCLAFDTLKYS